MKIKILGVLILLSQMSFAGEWTPPAVVNIAYAHSQYGGYGVYKISNSTTNPDGCNAIWYVVSKEKNPVFNEIYSLMLAAHLSGKKVQLYVEGCSPHNHPEIIHAKTVE